VFVKDALIENAEFYEVPAGTIIFQEGSFGEHLIILLRGAVRTSMNISVDANQQETVTLEDVRPGPDGFLGEMSVLSMNAHLFSAETLASSLLLLVPQFIVQELEVSQESFGQQIRQAYWKHACRALLRRVPLLRFSSEQEINQLTNEVTTKIFGVGTIIFKEQDAADDVHVIHQGFVRISKEVNGEQKILGYLGEGDGFGEMGVLSGAPRSATATAMSKTETIVIPGEKFRALVNAHPEARQDVQGMNILQRLDADMAAQVTFIGLQQEFRAEVMPNLDVLAIDETLCIRCDNCVKACAAAHEDGISRLIRKGVVFEEILLPTACRFCQDPVCLLCRSGGIKRDKDGDIYFTESCIGCGSCAERCPYGNIIMVDTEELGQPARPSLMNSLLGMLNKSEKKPVVKELEHRPYLKEIPVKCDLDKGHLFPACVNNCPTQAIKRYRADELDRIIARHGRHQ
jgi:CRP-like cAMP-binding protein/Fe-S-cluster-containing hydrogenase component 2